MAGLLRRVGHAARSTVPWLIVALAPFGAMSLLGEVLPDPVIATLAPVWIVVAIPAYIVLFGAPYVFVRELVSPGGIRSRTTGAVIGFIAGAAAISLVVSSPGPPIWLVAVSGALFAVLGVTEVVRDAPEKPSAG